MSLTPKKKPFLFLGSYSASFDKHQRVTLPFAWLKGFVGKMYGTKGYDGCIEIRNIDEIEKFSEQLSSLLTTHKNNRLHKRFCMGACHWFVVDSRGRFVVPDSLLKDCHIGKDMMLVGVGSHFELWDADIYEKWKSDNDVKLEDIPWVLEK